MVKYSSNGQITKCLVGKRERKHNFQQPVSITTSYKSSQCYISQSTPLSIDRRQLFPQDLFRLRINSNGTYSRFKHPTNNCHNSTIEFPQGSAESIQYRVAQCSRYQIVDFKIPVRNNKGIVTDRKRGTPFFSQVIKAPLSMALMTAGGTFKTKFGSLTPSQYEQPHEELEMLHLILECSSLNSQEMSNKANLCIIYPLHIGLFQKMTEKNSYIYAIATLPCTSMQSNTCHKKKVIFRISPPIHQIPIMPYTCSQDRS